MLARAWVRISKDPSIRSDQKSHAFYERFDAVFNRLLNPSAEERTAESLKGLCMLFAEVLHDL